MKYARIAAGPVCFAVLFFGLSQRLAAREAAPDLSQTNHPSVTVPGESATDMSAIVPKIAPPEEGYSFPAAVQVLAYNTYSQLAASHHNANFCFSPQLLAKQLTALRFGADGETAAEAYHVFPFKMPVAQTAEWLRQVDASTAQIREGVPVAQIPPTPTFGQANAVWVPTEHPIVEPYVNGIKAGLATELYAADLQNNRDSAATTVNAWVRDTSGGRLTSIIAEPFADNLPDDVSVITTGLVCAAPRLAAPFNRQFSGENTFQLASGETVAVPMMRQISACYGAEVQNLQILVMPCVEENLRLIVLLPAAGQLDVLERAMTPTALETWFGQLQPMVVDVILPQVQLTSRLELSETLNLLGMQTIATEDADLSYMSQNVEKGPLRLSKFLHAAQMTLTEQVDIPDQQVPQAQARFYVTRPFVFLVWNTQTATPLLLGRIMETGDATP